jgi:hypothetical protein
MATFSGVKDSAFYTALRNEIENDPTGLGYAAFRTSGADNALADALNLVRASVTIAKGSMSFADLMSAMVSALSGLTTAQVGQLQLLGLSGQIKIGDTTVRTYLEGVYNNATNKALLQAQYNRQGSRAEFLWGDGAYITLDDVVTAKFLNNATGW